ncbi:hypothetical protein CEK25_011658 [Fusarium fujikuroi]|nr:hypothetical protein CEK25_011658 [Fusarium fujikuroi]
MALTGLKLVSPFPGDNMVTGLEMDVWNQLDIDLKAHNCSTLVIDVWNRLILHLLGSLLTQFLEKALPGYNPSQAMAHSPILTDDIRMVPGYVSIRQQFPIFLPGVLGNVSLILQWILLSTAFLRSQIEQNPPTPSTTSLNRAGLRANWGSGSDLHNWMGNLIYSSTGTSEGTYYPNGEWQVYKYYAAMTGQRFLTKASSDSKFDVFATKEGHKIKILAGTRTVQEKYSIEVSGLGAVELPKKGTVKVRTYRFDWAGPNGKVDGPIDLGEKKYTYSADTLTLSVNPPTNATAFAYEFSI